MAKSDGAKKWHSLLGYAVILVWVAGGLGLGAAFMALHAPLAGPARTVEERSKVTANDASASNTVQNINELGNSKNEPMLRATHFISEGCRCSADVAAHLLARGRLKELTAEHVVLIGNPDFDTNKLEALGFTTEHISGKELFTKFGLDAAPLMKISQSDGKVAYLGGYYNSMARNKNLDAEIVELVKRGEPPRPYPSYGCAQSEANRAAQDPFGLKYERQEHVDHENHEM